MFSERIPLRKVKTVRNTLGEKKHAEQFPEGACLQTVPDFFSWLKYNYSPPEEHHGCECFGRMVLHSATWCFNLALGLIWRYHVKCKYMSIERVTCVVLIGCGLSLKGVTAVDQEGPPGEGVLSLV